MATQKSYYKTIFSSKGSSPPAFPQITIGGEDYKVVVDPYSGKYYGEAPKDKFVNFYKEQVKALKQNLAYYNSKQKLYYSPSSKTKDVLAGFLNPQGQGTALYEHALGADYTPGRLTAGSGINFSAGVPRLIDEKERQNLINQYNKALETAQAELQRFSGDGYVQKAKDEQFFRSYDMYKDTWDKFFEASWKNPRDAEEQKNRSARQNQQAQSQYTRQQDMNDLVAAQGGSTPKRTAASTGISSSTFNPFSQLETGLGV